jgi:hypothetical protein
MCHKTPVTHSDACVTASLYIYRVMQSSHDLDVYSVAPVFRRSDSIDIRLYIYRL